MPKRKNGPVVGIDELGLVAELDRFADAAHANGEIVEVLNRHGPSRRMGV